MHNKYIAIALSILMIFSLTSCGNDGNKETTNENDTQTIENSNENNTDSINSTIKIKSDDLKQAIDGHSFLPKNFTFEIEHNQVIQLAEDTEDTKYINSETWIYNGILNKGITDLAIEGEKADYSIAITFDSNNDYPSNISITFTSSNEIDAENMTAWTYQIIGEVLPPKLASAFQNAASKGLTENCYTESGIKASVFKENNINEDKSVTSNLNIMLSSGVEEINYTDINNFIIDKGSNLDIYQLNAFDYNSTIENMESRISGLFSNNAKTTTNMISTYYSKGIEVDKNSVYMTLNTIDNEFEIETTIITNSKTDLSTGVKDDTISIETRTPIFDSTELAYKSVENILNGLFGNNPDFSSFYTLEGGEVTLTDSENKTYGFPLALKLQLEQISTNKYSIVISGNTAKTVTSESDTNTSE